MFGSEVRYARMTSEPFLLDDQAEADRQTASLAGIAVVLLLIALGLALVRELRAVATMEDCLLAGRSSCPAELIR